MAQFLSDLFTTITNMFKSKKLEDNISDFQNRMNLIISDLILPYAQPPTEFAAKDRFRDLIALLDPKRCNKIAIAMSNNLDKNYTKLELEQFASKLLIGRNQTNCTDDSCADNAVPSMDNKKNKVSKKEICNAVAVHYVKILNLIAAVLTAVNPSDNMCLNRLRNLLTVISEDEQKGISGICDPIANVVKESIMLEPGFRELLMLYYYHLMQDTETEDEKNNVRNQYQILVKTLSTLLMFVDPSLKGTSGLNTLVAQELAELNNNLGDNENLNNLKKKMEKESENTGEIVPSTPQTATSNNIASLRKNISNFKDEENDKLNNLLNKIEDLNKIIAQIQNKTTEKSTPNTTVAPPALPAEPSQELPFPETSLSDLGITPLDVSNVTPSEPPSSNISSEPTGEISTTTETPNLPLDIPVERGSESDSESESETESEDEDDEDNEDENNENNEPNTSTSDTTPALTPAINTSMSAPAPSISTSMSAPAPSISTSYYKYYSISTSIRSGTGCCYYITIRRCKTSRIKISPRTN